MADNTDTPIDQKSYDTLRLFLLAQFSSRAEFQAAHDKVTSEIDDYIDLLNDCIDYHQNIRDERQVEMDVRHRLYNSQIGLPEQIYQNYEDWLGYFGLIEEATVMAKKQNDRSALLRAEYVNISIVWYDFWDTEEARTTYALGDGLKLLDIIARLTYYERRRKFLSDMFMADKEGTNALFMSPPDWVMFGSDEEAEEIDEGS